VSPVNSPVLEVRDLRVWYGSAQAVFGVSLSVHDGEIVGLLGRNGAGKTSTMLGIMGCGVRRRGEITFAGKPVTGHPMHRLARSGLGWVPDDRRVFPTLTVEENFRVARAAASGKDKLSDADLIDIFPLLASLLKRTAGVLSGGEQQVVSIARALVARPRVLLVDEPTEGLAPVVVDRLVDTLRRMKTELGQGMLLAEADQSVITEVADRVAVLAVGRNVYAAELADFARDTEVQRRYLSIGTD
jgi:branched-chain amino acid transport system ATP-binding protein